MAADDITIDLGNEYTLQDVFTKHYRPLCFYVKRLLGDNDQAAKDIVQDVFVSIWNRKLVFKNLKSLKSYLYYSVYHSCLDTKKSAGIHDRHHRTIRNEINRDAPVDKHFLTDRIEAEVLSEIFQAIEQLPHQCRRIFKMSYMENMSVEQVAAELEISVNTVKTQRTRAKKLLKERLKDLYPILAWLLLG